MFLRPSFLVTLSLALMLTGCAGGPQPGVEEGSALALFQSQQRSWYQTPRYWQAQGVMELDTPESGPRRHRVTLTGQGVERAKMTVQGPFQQVVGELWLDGEFIRLINKQEHEVWQTAASEGGLHRLVQVRLAPRRLLQVVLGLADPLDTPRLEEKSVQLGGETLQLDDLGRLITRSGHTDSQRPYRVAYGWPHGESPMPGRVEVSMGEAHQVVFVWQSWRFPDAAFGESQLTFIPPEGFRWRDLPEQREEP